MGNAAKTMIDVDPCLTILELRGAVTKTNKSLGEFDSEITKTEERMELLVTTLKGKKAKKDTLGKLLKEQTVDLSKAEQIQAQTTFLKAPAGEAGEASVKELQDFMVWKNDVEKSGSIGFGESSTITKSWQDHCMAAQKENKSGQTKATGRHHLLHRLSKR